MLAALGAVEREEQDTSRLWPWLLLGTGIALAGTGIAIGAGRAISCDDSCTMPFWPAWLVVGGSGLGAAGGLWLALKNREIAELRSRRYKIETELQHLEWSVLAPTNAPGAGSARAAFKLRYAF